MKKLFGVVTFWLALEYFVLGPFSYFPVYEWGDGVFPYHVNLFRDLITYGFSYWSRHFASGADYLAQGLSHTQAHGLLYLTLPTWLVTPVIFALRFFLSGYFTYRIAADHLELSKHGALFAGIAFSLFHLSFSTSPFSFSALPCLLWILDLILKKGGENARRWPAVVFAAVIYSLFESTSGSFPFVLPFILLWLIVLRKRRSVQDFGLLILFCLLLIALQTPTIWGLLAYAKGSHRIHGFPTETSRLFYPWENLASFKNYVMSFASPFFHSANRFDHALLLPLTLLAVFSHMLKNKKLNFVFFCLLLTTLGNMIFHTLTLAFYEHLGPFKGFHFKRFYYMTHLFYPLCAAFAFEKLPKRFHLKSGVVFLSFLMLFYSSLLYKKEHLSFWLDGASYTYVYDNQELKKLKTILGESESPFRVATVSDNHPETFMEPSLVNVYGLESADGYLNMYPKRYQEFWLNVIEPLKGQYAYFDIFKKWGNKIYLFLPEDRERYFLRKFSDYFRLNLLSLANVKYIISSPVAPIEDPNLVLIAKPDYPIPQRKDLALPTRLKKTFLKRDASLSKEETMIMLRSRLREIFSTGQDLLIYENKGVLPRFFLAPKAKGFPNSEALLDAMATANPENFQREVLAEEKYLENIEKLGFQQSTIKINRYSPDIIQLDVQLDGNGILIASNSYSPFWKAFVDGEEKEIFPAYHAFWGIYLTKGHHQVSLDYKPPYKLF